MQDSNDIKILPISQLRDFGGHPFKVETDIELFELTKRIESDGVIVSILVRTSNDGEGYEIIAGHRRKAASKRVGLSEIPAVIRELDYNQAIIAMVDSNLQREHIKPIEKAFVYRMKQEDTEESRRLRR